MRKLIWLIFLVNLVVSAVQAQDVNFMMYSNTSLNVNPAIISSTDYLRLSANYKNKTYINDVESSSAYFMFSRPLYKENSRYGGFGLSILSDQGGNTQQLICEGISGAYAHEVQLTSWSRLSLGLQASYLQKRIDTKQYSTGSQWVEGVGYDPTTGSGEQFESSSTGNFTLSSGLFWYIPKKDRTVKFYVGFAMYNLTKPSYSFFGAEQSEPFKYVANTAYEVYSKGNFSIMPQVLYYNSYHENHFTIGSKWTYLFNVRNERWLFSSGSLDLITDYQLKEGIALGLQVNQPNYSIGIGYGFADHFTNNYTPEKGVVEISFSFKKSLFSKPVKRPVDSDTRYARSQLRDFVFEEPEDQVVNNKEVEEVEKEIKKETDKEVKFKLEKDFQFDFNKAELNDEAKAYINDIVILLAENKMLNIEIIGHTDNVGTRLANQRISEERAEVVKDYLIEKGVSAQRISTKGMADTKPLFENNNQENRSKNRRVEFVIYY